MNHLILAKGRTSDCSGQAELAFGRARSEFTKAIPFSKLTWRAIH
jgi:hypothetical protein